MPVAAASSSVTIDGFDYSIDLSNAIVTIEGCTQSYSKLAVEIPSTITTTSYGELPVLIVGSNFLGKRCKHETVKIPEYVALIDLTSFYNCKSLKSIIVDENNFDYSSDEYGVLFNKEKTELLYCPRDMQCEHYTIPESVTSIGKSAFEGCTGIKAITIPDSVTSIGDSAFSACTGITNITIPESVTSIGNKAFSGCEKIKNITIPANAKLGGDVFLNCSALENVVFCDGTTEIGKNFENCYNLKNLNIPESVNYIAIDAFYGSGLEKIVINNPKCVIEYSASTIPVDAIIYGHANSPAQMYAQMYGRDFVALSAAECSHSYSEWIIDADATCTQRGFAHRVCTLCNGYEFDVIDETGHIDEDADNICDVCDTSVSVQLPDTDDGGESGDNNSSDGISSFFESIRELFNKISAWIKSIFGMA